MSNPTSNFGWPMPTPTDLVTDLPADFEVFGQAVDTDLAGLNGGTTGQILSKTSATDLAFTWINNDQGDITGVTAGTGISGGGTSGTVTVTNSMATAITTSGDLIQGTGSGTFARLATGTNGQYLTTNGTTNSWVTPPTSAAALTKINTTSFSAVSSVSTDSLFSSTYDVYRIVLSFTSSGSNNIAYNLRSGGVDTTTGYVLQTLQSDDTTVNASRTTTSNFANYGSTGINAIMIDMFNPNVASRTNSFVRMIRDAGGTANQFLNATTQTDSTQFTGIKFIPAVGTITGYFTVYGYEK